jgi:GNAT superfamily N-acetyltransferase
MDIQILPWKDVNPTELAQFSVLVRRQEGLTPESMTIETQLNAINWWMNRNDSKPILAYIDDRLVGWLVFFSFLPTIATIGRWHPIVTQHSQKDEIAQQLLKTSIDLAKSRDYTRLEVEVTGITPENEYWYEQNRKWYEAQGLSLSSEESRLERDLTQSPLPKPALASEFQICPITQFTNDELQAPFFEMFDNSMDRFWLDQTPDQRKECFRFWFDRERPFVEKATGVLLKDKEIIGLTVVRLIQEVGMLGPVAITPHYRRQGLGRALMAFSFHGALKSGITTIQLEFDITNEPALQLYTELGFTHVHRLAIFAISL